MFRALIEQIYENDVKSKRWKILYGIAANIGCLRVIEGRQLVGDIGNITRGVHLPQLALDGTYQVILQTNI